MNTELMIAELTRDEGKIPYIYDDANGKPIVPGYTCVGHPTVGVGRALDVRPLTPREINFLLNEDISKTHSELWKSLPWLNKLDEVRERVLVNMAFNMGVAGLLTFVNTLAMIQHGEYVQAADEMLKSKWAGQVGERAQRLATMMRTGVDV